MSAKPKSDSAAPESSPAEPVVPQKDVPETGATESGGRGGLDPTRYGDWEVGGICSDF